jgi:hypothetical protein
MRIAALVLAVLASGCGTLGLERKIGIRAMHPPTSLVCKDGRPVLIITAEACEGGICGWSCAPERWR